MTKLYAILQSYIQREEGATAIEYGLIAAGIALAISVAVLAFGDTLTGLFTDMGTTLEGAAS